MKEGSVYKIWKSRNVLNTNRTISSGDVVTSIYAEQQGPPGNATWNAAIVLDYVRLSDDQDGESTQTADSEHVNSQIEAASILRFLADL